MLREKLDKAASILNSLKLNSLIFSSKKIFDNEAYYNQHHSDLFLYLTLSSLYYKCRKKLVLSPPKKNVNKTLLPSLPGLSGYWRDLLRVELRRIQSKNVLWKWDSYILLLSMCDSWPWRAQSLANLSFRCYLSKSQTTRCVYKQA